MYFIEVITAQPLVKKKPSTVLVPLPHPSLMMMIRIPISVIYTPFKCHFWNLCVTQTDRQNKAACNLSIYLASSIVKWILLKGHSSYSRSKPKEESSPITKHCLLPPSTQAISSQPQTVTGLCSYLNWGFCWGSFFLVVGWPPNVRHVYRSCLIHRFLFTDGFPESFGQRGHSSD